MYFKPLWGGPCVVLFQNFVWQPHPSSNMLMLLKIEIIRLFLLYFQCNCITMSCLTYFLGFLLKFSFSWFIMIMKIWPIVLKPSTQKAFIQIKPNWIQMLFRWPTFKIVSDSPVLYLSIRFSVLLKEEISFIDPILFILFQLILVVFVERI